MLHKLNGYIGRLFPFYDINTICSDYSCSTFVNLDRGQSKKPVITKLLANSKELHHSLVLLSIQPAVEGRKMALVCRLS